MMVRDNNESEDDGTRPLPSSTNNNNSSVSKDDFNKMMSLLTTLSSSVGELKSDMGEVKGEMNAMKAGTSKNTSTNTSNTKTANRPIEVNIASDNSSISTSTPSRDSYASAATNKYPTATADGFTLVEYPSKRSNGRSGSRKNSTSNNKSKTPSSSTTTSSKSPPKLGQPTTFNVGNTDNKFHVNFWTYSKHWTKHSNTIKAEFIATIINGALSRFDPDSSSQVYQVAFAPSVGHGDNLRFSGAIVICTNDLDQTCNAWQYLLREGRLLTLSDEDTGRYGLSTALTALRFNLPPVNAFKYTTIGYLEGVSPNWFTPSDFTALKRGALEIIGGLSEVVSAKFLDEFYDDKWGLAALFGLYFHDIKKNKDGSVSRILSIAVSDDEAGRLFGKNLMQCATHSGSKTQVKFKIFGGIIASIQPFPAGDLLKPYLLKCAADTHELTTKKSYVHRLIDLANNLLVDPNQGCSILYDIVNKLEWCMGAIPTSLDGSNGSAGLTLVFHPDNDVMLSRPEDYRSIIIDAFPDIDPRDTHSQVVDVHSSTATAANINLLMDNVGIYVENDSGKYFVVLWGQGGFVCVGIYSSYEGPKGAKQHINGVSYNVFFRRDHIEDCWALIQEHYGSHIVDEESLRTYVHMRAPLKLTNLHINWAPKSLGLCPHSGNVGRKRSFTLDPPGDRVLHDARAKLAFDINNPPNFQLPPPPPPGFESTCKLQPPSMVDTSVGVENDDDIVEETPRNEIEINDDDTAEFSDCHDGSQELLSQPTINSFASPSKMPPSSPAKSKRRDDSHVLDGTPSKKKRQNKLPPTAKPTNITSPTSVSAEANNLAAVRVRVPPFTSRTDLELNIAPLLSDASLVSEIKFQRASGSNGQFPYFAIFLSRDLSTISYLANVLDGKSLHGVEYNPAILSASDWEIIEEVTINENIDTLSVDSLVQYVKARCDVDHQEMVSRFLCSAEDGKAVLDYFLSEVQASGKLKSS